MGLFDVLLVGGMAVAIVAPVTLLLPGRVWSPWRNVLVNTAIRKAWPLPYLTTKWLVRGQWYSFRDRSSSITLKIAYEEVCKGFYTPQVPLRAGDVVLDIGAHVGMFAIPLARENPGVRFICYEPSHENYANLKHNIAASGVQNIWAVNEGVWNEAAYLVNQPDPRNTGGNRTRPSRCEGDVDVRATSLDAIRTTWNIDTIRVLKMDCEGAEYHALRTPNDLRGVDNLLLEVHGGEYAGLLALAKSVPQHRIQILQDSHVTIDSAGTWKPHSLGVPA